MKIQLISDLHLECERPSAEPGKEFYNFDFLAAAEYLALLGFVGCTFQEEMFVWLRAQLPRFKKIFFVSGNHGECRDNSPCTDRLRSHRTLSLNLGMRPNPLGLG